MNFTNSIVDLWTKDTVKRLYCFTIKNDPRLAMKLNKVLQCYPVETRFTDKDEPMFKFSYSQIEYIRAEIPYLSKILAQSGYPIPRYPPN